MEKRQNDWHLQRRRNHSVQEYEMVVIRVQQYGDRQPLGAL